MSVRACASAAPEIDSYQASTSSRSDSGCRLCLVGDVMMTDAAALGAAAGA